MHTSKRKLAAILFTDIVGYTALMQRDERAAIAAVKKHQSVLESCVDAHQGEIYQYYGDGSLSIFNSALDAVRCAHAVQKEMLTEPQVPLRTGIHIGEIHYEDNKIFGDGVNLASRIESIGQPGTVFFSRHVYEKVRNHSDLQTQSLGVFSFKNVDVPMEVFALVNPDIKVPDKKHIAGKIKEGKKQRGRMLWPALLIGIAVIAVLSFWMKSGAPFGGLDDWEGGKSIAVLPFKSISGQEEDDFLSIGIAEDILTQLSKVGDLKVISRESSSKYKDTDKSQKTIARELGVATLLQGSVRRAGNKVRISVQLVDPEQETYIWAEDFDKEIEDILNLQRDVAEAVTDALKVNLAQVVRGQFQKRAAVNPDAYISYQLGHQTMRTSSGDPVQLAQTVRYFEEAVQLDPDFALAWVGLAEAQLEYLFWGRARSDDIFPKARKPLDNALNLDPNLGEGYCLLGTIAMFDFDFQIAETLFRQAIENSPNYAPAYERLAMVRIYTGEQTEVLELLRKAMELDPLSTKYISTMAHAHYSFGEYDRAIAVINKYLDLYPGDNYLLWNLAYMHVGKGNYETAIKLFKQRTISGAEQNWMLGVAYAKSGEPEKTREILQYQLDKARQSYVPKYIIAVLYMVLDEQEKAFEYLEQSVHEGDDANYLWGLSIDPTWEPFRGQPRFQELVQKILGQVRDASDSQ